MVVKPTEEQIKQRENEARLKRSQDEVKERLLNDLRNESLGIIALAAMYAKNFESLGFDITERWVTAEQQGEAVEKIYKKGYADGLLKGREIEGETIRKKMEIEKKRRHYDNCNYLDDDVGQNKVSESLRNMVRPANVKNHGKGKRKRHRR